MLLLQGQTMSEKHVVLETKMGKLKGQIKNSTFTNKPYYAFQGIPYGKPPIGDLRFKAPQPFGSWKGIRDALKDGNEPAQYDFLQLLETQKFSVKGDEDCLFLNVFMNEFPEPSSSLKPVAFSIHGGGFTMGSGNSTFTGPDNLLVEDVIVVIINYRVGPFGFLSLENGEVPGNGGLKDQTLALKWVRDNIQSFGGDPNNVTIFGISAGGASVHYQLLSPLSKGLFHKAIIQSGFASNPWAFQNSPRKNALILAKALGCTSEDNNEVLKFLQSAPAEDIVRASYEKMDVDKRENCGFIFTPCVEKTGTEPFITDFPDNLMKKGEFTKVPVIIGAALREGTVGLLVDGVNEERFKNLNKNQEQLVPSFLGLEAGSSEEKAAAKEIWEFYFKENLLSWDNVSSYVDLLSDLLFNISMETTRSGLVEHSPLPVFTYLFTNHTRCMCKMIMKKSIAGPIEHPDKLLSEETCHGSDMLFVYTSQIFDPLKDEAENAKTEEIKLEDPKQDILKYIKVWTNFISLGDPNCKELEAEWERDSLTNPHFMDIGKTWKLKSGVPFAERMNFWKKITLKYSSSIMQ